MFGNVVMEVEHDKFESIIDSVKQKKNITQDTEMDAEGWQEVIKLYEEKITEEFIYTQTEDQINTIIENV